MGEITQENMAGGSEIKALYQEIERKDQELSKLNDLKNEFVSTVSHELRTPLAIIREATSQVLDQTLGKINPKQKRFLAISLDGIDRLGRIVDDLLDISKIEAGKLALRRELTDIVKLAKEVQSNFLNQARGKGLALKLQCSSSRIEMYIDRDRITQVFTNLLSNALKFTEQGYIEMIISENEHVVECCVLDTGKGISQEDLPRVFSKFEQFNREFGPGEKGTGLGLAISKGIVETHQGSIRVESAPTFSNKFEEVGVPTPHEKADVGKSGRGAQFIFTLPKVTSRQLFKEQITRNIKEAIKQESSLAVIVFEVKNFETLEKKLRKRLDSILEGLEFIVKQNLRRRADVAMKDKRRVLLLLPDTDKENAPLVAGRMQKAMNSYLIKQKLRRQVAMDCKIVVFPEDGHKAEELLMKAGVQE